MQFPFKRKGLRSLGTIHLPIDAEGRHEGARGVVEGAVGRARDDADVHVEALGHADPARPRREHEARVVHAAGGDAAVGGGRAQLLRAWEEGRGYRYSVYRKGLCSSVIK